MHAIGFWWILPNYLEIRRRQERDARAVRAVAHEAAAVGRRATPRSSPRAGNLPAPRARHAQSPAPHERPRPSQAACREPCQSGAARRTRHSQVHKW